MLVLWIYTVIRNFSREKLISSCLAVTKSLTVLNNPTQCWLNNIGLTAFNPSSKATQLITLPPILYVSKPELITFRRQRRRLSPEQNLLFFRERETKILFYRQFHSNKNFTKKNLEKKQIASVLLGKTNHKKKVLQFSATIKYLISINFERRFSQFYRPANTKTKGIATSSGIRPVRNGSHEPLLKIL